MTNKEKEAGVEERPIRVSNTFKRCGSGIKANSLRKRFLKNVFIRAFYDVYR